MLFIYSADETMHVGGDLALPVPEEYPIGEKIQFMGNIHWVRVDLENNDVSHHEPDKSRDQ